MRVQWYHSSTKLTNGIGMTEQKTMNEDAGLESGLTAVLLRLEEQGCYPAISYRGKGIWRAHVNGAGNFWCDAKRPEDAMESAVRLWERAGKPMDGYSHN